MPLTSGWNKFFQSAALISQTANSFSGVVPPKYQPIVMLALTAFQAVVGILAQYKNPDGTPATTAYIPPVK